MINDFYKFFQESWACAIYHDRFDKLQELNQRDLLSDDQEEDLNLLQIISEKIIKNNHKRVSFISFIDVSTMYLFFYLNKNNCFLIAVKRGSKSRSC